MFFKLTDRNKANAKAFRFDIVNPADFDTVVDIDEKQGWAVFVTVKSQTAQGNRPEIAMCGMRKRKLHAAYLDLLRGLAVNMNNHRAKYLVGKQESKWKVEPTDFSELRAGSPTRG